MAKQKSKNRKTDKKRKISGARIIGALLVCCVIFIAAAEGLGYDPLNSIKERLDDTLSSDVSDELTVSFIDVGQGDCIYISTGDENMLIDCGEASEADRVAAYLEELGVSSIDYVVATHPHSDHMGGMSEIVLNYEIGEMIMPHLDDSDIPTTRYFEKFLDACEEKDLQVTEAQLGRVISLGDAEAEIIAPISEDYSGANNYSVGIILTHGSNSFLFTGDAEELAESEMLESGKLSHVRVYKVNHHGSDTSSSEEFLEAISPEYAVIMCGEGNSYGHPHEEVLDRLSEYVKQIYRTDLNGNVIFESDGTTLVIRTER
ncbi:MAG: MBL fold metallo-hydrolase [Ruminococcus sp.]|nr:MBL fold metallo-hydrolase [Ruminococcus sp.]